MPPSTDGTLTRSAPVGAESVTIPCWILVRLFYFNGERVIGSEDVRPKYDVLHVRGETRIRFQPVIMLGEIHQLLRLQIASLDQVLTQRAPIRDVHGPAQKNPRRPSASVTAEKLAVGRGIVVDRFLI